MVSAASECSIEVSESILPIPKGAAILVEAQHFVVLFGFLTSR